MKPRNLPGRPTGAGTQRLATHRNLAQHADELYLMPTSVQPTTDRACAGGALLLLGGKQYMPYLRGIGRGRITAKLARAMIEGSGVAREGRRRGWWWWWGGGGGNLLMGNCE
eukprot:SAG31_NODE_14359_length_811_cov_1.411517_2_plen_112_part_00